MRYEPGRELVYVCPFLYVWPKTRLFFCIYVVEIQDSIDLRLWALLGLENVKAKFHVNYTNFQSP